MSEHLPAPEPGSMLPPPGSAPAPRRPRGAQRWLRILAPIGVVAIALGGVAVAQAAIDDSGNDSPRDLLEQATPTSLPDGSPEVGDDHGGLGGGDRTVEQNVTVVADAIADGSTQTFAAGAAGTVTIGHTGSTLTVVSSTANAGWTATVEASSGPEVEVTFTAPGARIDLEAEIEDGGVRVRVRERTLVADPGTTDPTTPRADSSGPGGTDDSPDVDDDHGGSGSGSDDSPDVDDDHGGSGSGTDDSPDVDEDHPGSGGSGSPGSSGSGSARSGSSVSGGSGSSGSGSSGSGSSGSGGSGSGSHGSDD